MKNLKELIDEIVKEAIVSDMPKVFLREDLEDFQRQQPSDSEQLAKRGPGRPKQDKSLLAGALVATKANLKKANLTPEQIAAQEKQIDSLVNKLLHTRQGRATLTHDDMEKLDLWTRWMTLFPFGKAYRRGLAKYLKSKASKRKEDPFKDFRRYTYDKDNQET
jgi:hypothetical protein